MMSATDNGTGNYTTFYNDNIDAIMLLLLELTGVTSGHEETHDSLDGIQQVVNDNILLPMEFYICNDKC